MVKELNLPSADSTAMAAVISDCTDNGDVIRMKATMRLSNVPFSIIVWKKQKNSYFQLLWDSHVYKSFSSFFGGGGGGIKRTGKLDPMSRVLIW